jgi:Nucleoporin FG repeated region
LAHKWHSQCYVDFFLELVQAVKRLHEIFITVASKLQQVHGTVEQKKEQYLLLRQQLLHDTTDIFQSLQRARQGPEARSTGLSGGPSLFSSKF